MGKILRRGAALAALLMMAGLLAPSASAAPYCGITWGSLPKAGPSHAHTSATINDVRAGRHDCYDRLVVDMTGGPAPEWYHVSYVSTVHQQGSGVPVPLAGGAFLDVLVGSAAHDQYYNPTYQPANPMQAVNVAGFTTFRQVAFLGTFEGQTQFGMGVRARLPFRVFTLTGPGSTGRLVIDVAHRW
ncbi:hypothetical protein C8D87_108423 [Lentzea atacamensis]|uniref:AMIN-like domain-containing protein n=1 Tax=Lentzea atacamensis TaxID=531938 RepID=A0ABX9E267_9PSEU|nr:hypothetical protein [Lentzea atacamensis]RAS62599.1 hypothetical protein C8D87_108423 [Lentzea atacamensis]